jgi:hypothetical protein
MHPAANSGCARCQRTISSLLVKIGSERRTDWAQHLPYVAFCYNSTQYKLFAILLMLLLEPVYRIGMLLGNPTAESAQSHPLIVANMNERMRCVYNLTRQNAKNSALQSRKWESRKVHEVTFNPIYRVPVYNARRYNGLSPKLQRVYNE